MLKFIDFVPKRVAHAAGISFFKDGSTLDFESFESAVGAAGKWVQEANVDVRQIETVVLPNIWLPGEEGSTDPAVKAVPHAATIWHQFVRIWYWGEAEPA